MCYVLCKYILVIKRMCCNNNCRSFSNIFTDAHEKVKKENYKIFLCRNKYQFSEMITPPLHVRCYINATIQLAFESNLEFNSWVDELEWFVHYDTTLCPHTRTHSVFCHTWFAHKNYSASSCELNTKNSLKKKFKR